MNQKIILITNGYLLIDQKFSYEFYDLFLVFPVKLSELLNRSIAAVLHPVKQTARCLFVQLRNGLFRDLFHKEFKALQRHEFMVSHKADRIWHLHKLEQCFYRMRPPIQHIAKNIKGIRILKIHLLKKIHKHIIFAMNIRYYVC